MVKEELKKQIDSFPFWYHKIDLNGVVTTGWAPIDSEIYDIPKDLTGKRVLDVGAWDGYWTFEALKRGAKQVVAIDNWSDLPKAKDAYVTQKDYNPERKQWDTFDFCKSVLGYSDEQCKRYTMSVYDAKSLGEFDVIFFFGTLYHLRYPLLALDILSSICKESIYVETAICDDYSPYNDAIGNGHNTSMVMEFYPKSELGNMDTNWWSPTLNCLANMVASSGFKTVDAWKIEKPEIVARCRGYVKATK